MKRNNFEARLKIQTNPEVHPDNLAPHSSPVYPLSDGGFRRVGDLPSKSCHSEACSRQRGSALCSLSSA